MAKWTFFFLVLICGLVGAGAQAGTLSTDFEFPGTPGDFTLGAAPESATFSGGNVAAPTSPALARSGRQSWLLHSGETAAVTFETPVDKVCLFVRDSGEETTARILFHDTSDRIVTDATALHGTWTRRCAVAPSRGPFISRIDIHRPAGDGLLAVDDLFSDVGRRSLSWLVADGTVETIRRVNVETTGLGRAARLFPLPASRQVVAVADLDGNRMADILIHDGEADTVSVMRTFENGTVTGAEEILSLGTRYRFVNTGDFDGDGKADLLIEDRVVKALRVFLMDGADIRSQAYLFPYLSFLTCPGVGDLDGDGDDDLLLRLGSLLLALMVDEGAPAGIEVIHRRFRRTHDVAGIHDLDGDGKADLQIVNGIGQWRAWRMDGAVIADDVPLGWLGRSWKIVGTGDVDADGSEDLLLYRPDHHGGPRANAGQRPPDGVRRFHPPHLPGMVPRCRPESAQ